MIGFLGGLVLGSASSNNSASNYIITFRPWQEVLPFCCFAFGSAFLFLYLIMIFATYKHYKEYLEKNYLFSSPFTFSMYSKFSQKEIEQFNINFQIQYLTAKTTFLSSSYIVKKILKNKINTKVKELKLLQEFNQ